MANTDNMGTLDTMISTWFSKKMLRHIEPRGLRYDAIFYDEATNYQPPATKEEPMSEILPKDLLKHLEKGDRSAEFIETQPQVEGALTVETIRDAVAQMRNVDTLNDIQRMEQQMRDMQQMQNQYMQNVGMASAQMFTRPGGIVRWG